MKPIKYKNRGAELAKALWPLLELEPEGSFWDKYGIDGHLNGLTVQVKYDRRIAISMNIYHEFYEKTANLPEQTWRKSPGIAIVYIFTTETNLTIMGYLIPIDTLAKAEMGKRLQVISPNAGAETSIGILVPLNELKYEFREGKK